jgi:hypothetical protein
VIFGIIWIVASALLVLLMARSISGRWPRCIAARAR